VTEFRRNWAPFIIVATYCVALLIPALLPSVEAKNALPSLDAPIMAENIDMMGMGDMSAGTGPSEAVMAALHEQASAALRDLQMASQQPQ
jgi:hypothetical protein